MQLSVDPKPAAAFVEYILKPLLDDARELLVLLQDHGLKASDLQAAVRLFVFDRVLAFLTSILVTGMICLTALAILRSHP